MKVEVTTAKPSQKLVLTKETLRVSTGIRAGTGSAGCSSQRPTSTPWREMDPQDSTTG